MTTAQTSNKPSTATSDSGKGLTNADKTAAAKKAGQGNVGRTKPWADLPANPKRIEEGPAPREKTVLHAMITLLKERGPKGATLAEIKKEFEKINLGHHDPAALCRWASKERGYGFHMKKDEHVVLRTKADE